MRSNSHGKYQRENKRLLAGLEGRYEKDTAHVRRYTRDCAAIDRLLKDGDIDKADAYELRTQAKKQFDIARIKIAAKRKVARDKAFQDRYYGLALLICLAIVVGFFIFLDYQFGS